MASEAELKETLLAVGDRARLIDIDFGSSRTKRYGDALVSIEARSGDGISPTLGVQAVLGSQALGGFARLIDKPALTEAFPQGTTITLYTGYENLGSLVTFGKSDDPISAFGLASRLPWIKREGIEVTVKYESGISNLDPAIFSALSDPYLYVFAGEFVENLANHPSV